VVNQPPTAEPNFANAFRTAVLVLDLNGTDNPIPLDGININNRGWAISPEGDLIVPESGTYSVQFRVSINVDQTNPDEPPFSRADLQVWATVNDSPLPIPGSLVFDEIFGVSFFTVVSTFMVVLNAGDLLGLRYDLLDVDNIDLIRIFRPGQDPHAVNVVIERVS